MRHTHVLSAALLALTVAACARQQPAFYVTDSATGQRIATAQQGASVNQRGLFSSSAPQTTADHGYASAWPQSQPSTTRGLFNSGLFSTRSRAPAYADLTPAPKPYPPQTYSYRPPQQPASMQQSSTMQYRPPQPAQQAHAQQRTAMMYRPPQPQPLGYDTERYGWY